jgi:predicted Zn finger-like uncharacterized protein
MRIACPSCQAEYDVPDTMLAGRRAVRCARCGEEWHPEPAAPAATESLPATVPEAEPPAVEPEPAAAAEPAASPTLFVPPREPRAGRPAPQPRRAGAGVLVGWVATVVILAGLLYTGYAWRDRLMAAWPPSTRLYAALGLAH